MIAELLAAARRMTAAENAGVFFRETGNHDIKPVDNRIEFAKLAIL